MPTEIRVDDRRFDVLEWYEQYAVESELHACGKPIVATFKATLPRAVAIGAVVDMGPREDGGCGVVDGVTPEPDGGFVVRGSIVRPARTT